MVLSKLGNVSFKTVELFANGNLGSWVILGCVEFLGQRSMSRGEEGFEGREATFK